MKEILYKKTKYILGIIVLTIPIALASGLASAALLYTLKWGESYRENHLWIVWLLPLAGFLVGALYYYYGKSVVKGNNLIIEEYHKPKEKLPLKMAPFVFLGTVITHLFGGSAGREGTAIQMGASLSDQIGSWIGTTIDRRYFLMMGTAAGFASLFGTPLAATFFAVEVFKNSKIDYRGFFPSLVVAILANFICHLTNAPHSHYEIGNLIAINGGSLIWVLLVGVLSGFVALAFVKTHQLFSKGFNKIKYVPLHPLIGGLLIALYVYFSKNTDYIGLGLPQIITAFSEVSLPYDFLAKLLLTTFTIAAGFKGGEVTPLFFIGATLGSALNLFIPLPVGLLAGVGFVSVFAGATNTPIACTIMGVELFGAEGLVFFAIGSFTAYITSGQKGIYESQRVEKQKGEW